MIANALACRVRDISLLFLVFLVAGGCSRRVAESTIPAEPTVPIQEAVEVTDIDLKPNEIVLSEPRITLIDPTLIQFEVKYRFSQGGPDKFYSCEVQFPGTKNRGRKLMDSWELKKEGIIKDGIRLAESGVTSYEIHITEATSPRETYHKISNVLSGKVQ